MAEKPSWQNQNYSKSGSVPGPQSMGQKIMGNSLMQMHSKIARPTVANYADGGEVSEDQLKQEGLKASAGENVGLIERFKMGNIDQPGSEAYNRFGAGRGRQEREMDAAIKSFEGLPSTSGDQGAPKEEAKPQISTAGDFQRTDKDTTSVPTPAKSAVKSAAKRAAPSVTDTGDETARLAKRYPAPEPKAAPAAKAAPAKPTYDRNRPDTRPGQMQSVTDRENRENFEKTPLIRGINAAADWLSKPHGSAPKRNPSDMPSIYASAEEWAAYRKRQAERAQKGE